jgi:drug/metabolite transporter (DMT)-like permease
MSPHLKGLLIAFLGVVALSPDSLIVLLIETDQWTLLFWRGLLTSAGIVLMNMAIHRQNTLFAYRRIGRSGILISILFAGATVFFVTALRHTSVANTLVIVSSSPIFAALLSRLILNEFVARHTWITIGVVILAVGLIVYESLGAIAFFGDVCALGSAVFVAGNFVIIRRARNIDMTPAMALGGVLTALVVLPWAMPLHIDSRSAILLLALGGFLSIAITLLTISPRYIPAPEVSLLMPLEIVFGSCLVWLVIGEQPTVSATIGGFIIITALSLNAARSLRSSGENPA